MDSKGFADDLTEGKYSFPVIHAIRNNPDNDEVQSMYYQM